MTDRQTDREGERKWRGGGGLLEKPSKTLHHIT